MNAPDTTMKAGGHLDSSRRFIPLGIAIVTISDSRSTATDTSGDLLAERIAAAGHNVQKRALMPAQKSLIQAQLRAWIADPAIAVIITNGGTGLSDRDVAPEAASELFDTILDGFAALWHFLSYQSVGVSTIQSRACAGIAGKTVIYVLPGSNAACRDGWDKLISLHIDSRYRPCSIVEITQG